VTAMADRLRTHSARSVSAAARSAYSAQPRQTWHSVPAWDRNFRRVVGEAVRCLALRHRIRRTCRGARVSLVGGGRPFSSADRAAAEVTMRRLNSRSWSPRRRLGLEARQPDSGPVPRAPAVRFLAEACGRPGLTVKALHSICLRAAAFRLQKRFRTEVQRVPLGRRSCGPRRGSPPGTPRPRDRDHRGRLARADVQGWCCNDPAGCASLV